MEDDYQRFLKETGEEAHYWFTVSDFAKLTEQYGYDKMISDVKALTIKLKEKQNG